MTKFDFMALKYWINSIKIYQFDNLNILNAILKVRFI